MWRRIWKILQNFWKLNKACVYVLPDVTLQVWEKHLALFTEHLLRILNSIMEKTAIRGTPTAPLFSTEKHIAEEVPAQV